MSSADEEWQKPFGRAQADFTNSAFYSFFVLKVGFVKIRRLPNIPLL